MNYDIHVGSILGFPGKVLAFLVRLIGASLPVTGFLIWYFRKFKKKKGGGKKDVKATEVRDPNRVIPAKPKVRIITEQRNKVVG